MGMASGVSAVTTHSLLIYNFEVDGFASVSIAAYLVYNMPLDLLA